MLYRYLYLPACSDSDFLVCAPSSVADPEVVAGSISTIINPVLIPPELLTEIIRYLPCSDQRVCLSVSRYFHDIAVRFVFRTVQIYLGEWANLRALEWWNAPSMIHENRSWELLYHILYDPHFAKIVKKVIVQGPTMSNYDINLPGSCLVQGLEAIPHLLEFHWLAAHHNFTQELAETLATFQNLQELTLPTQTSFHVKGLARIKGLRSLSCPKDNHFAMQKGILHIPSYFHDIIVENAATIQKLALPLGYLSRVPRDVFDNLIHLEVWEDGDPKFVNELRRALPYTHQLESLVIQVYGGGQIFHILHESSLYLDHLRSFKLLTSNNDAPPHHTLLTRGNRESTLLARFLRALPMLRRLDLDLGTLIDRSTLLPCLHELIHLEVLGLSVSWQAHESDNLALLVQHLPDTLTDLRLVFWGGSRGIPSCLLQRVRQLASLNFLYLTDWTGSLKLISEELIADFKHLALLALDDQIWSVSRTGPGPVLLPWTEHQMASLSLEYFGHTDPYWLMKHHVLRSSSVLN